MKTLYACSGGRNTVTTAGNVAATSSDFDANCCDAIVTPTGTDCPAAADLNCPTGMEKNTGVAQYFLQQSECCILASTHRLCSSQCTTGTSFQMGADSCGQNAKSVCFSTVCAVQSGVANSQVLDQSPSKIYALADNAAAQKTACCIPNTETCANWEVTTAGTSSSAYFNNASVTLLMLAAYLVKFAF
jgi:hypothetical protein